MRSHVELLQAYDVMSVCLSPLTSDNRVDSMTAQYTLMFVHKPMPRSFHRRFVSLPKDELAFPRWAETPSSATLTTDSLSIVWQTRETER